MKLKNFESEFIQNEDGSSQIRVENVDGKIRISNVQNLAPKLKETTIDYLNSLSEAYPYKTAMLQMYSKWKNLFETMPAGAKHHHTYVGGLSKHTAQVISAAICLWEFKKDVLSSQVSRDDIIIAGFLHDLSKVQVYRRLVTTEEIDKNGGRPFTVDNQIKYLDLETWTMHQCMLYGIILTEQQINALMYAEGGFSTWIKGRFQPQWTPLGVLISAADVYSACALKS